MGLKGYRLWVMGQLVSTCRAPPLDGEVQQQKVRGVAVQVVNRVRKRLETGFSLDRFKG
jgi:hypothetical protein